MMHKNILLVVLLTVLINNSLESPVNSRFRVHNKAENIFTNNEDLNGFKNDNNPSESLKLRWRFRIQWNVPQTKGWEFWTGYQSYEDFTTENFDISSENNFQTDNDFQTDDYFTENFGQESTESPIEETSEDRDRIFTDKQASETSTTDYMNPCGPLIVELDRSNYFLTDREVSTIRCNAYYAKHFQSRCNDGSIFNAKFNLIINGQTVIEEYMKRVSMNYDGFYSQFFVSESILRSLSHNNQKHFSAVCDVTISTDSGSASNQSYKSLLNLNDAFKTTDDWMLSTEEPTIGFDELSTQYQTKDDFSTETQTAMSSTDTCGSLNVLIVKTRQTYGHNGNITISCQATFEKQCHHDSVSYAIYQLIIDGIDTQEKYMTKYSIWSPELHTEFVVKNSVLEDLSRNYHKLDAYCHVSVVTKSSKLSNHSSKTSLQVNNDISDTGSPLNGSCSYIEECKANRNLTCDWDRKCRCIYDAYLGAYYVPYEQSNEWYCAKPAKYNELCFHNNQCKILNKGSICTQTTIGKVCVCDQMYYWNGFNCLSVEHETTTTYYSFVYKLHSNYSFTKIVGVSFAATFGGFIFVVLALRLLANKKKQVKRQQNVNHSTLKKRFVPHLFIIGKSEDKKEVIKEDKTTKFKFVK